MSEKDSFLSFLPLPSCTAPSTPVKLAEYNVRVWDEILAGGEWNYVDTAGDGNTAVFMVGAMAKMTPAVRSSQVRQLREAATVPRAAIPTNIDQRHTYGFQSSNPCSR